MPPSSIVAAFAIGVSLGLLGGGGSILTVPALVYWVGLPPLEATTSSLVVVGLTSLSAALQHFHGGRLQLRPALVFAGAGVPGSFAGSIVSRRIPPQALLVAFALLMAAAGVAMLLRRDYQPAVRASLSRVIPAGLAVGILTGVLGVGGGFLIVPALVLFAGLSMVDAVGTSVAVIAVNCAGGFAGRISAADTVQWKLTLGFSAVAIAGSFAGAALVGRIAVRWLRRGFGAFVLAIAGYMIASTMKAVP
ncbi:MAG TPA: sulfite exporter TauE/SafE family protein [Myxococcales bacterium]|nr:sulfite exporter TauE/SafE family protein [Myxococcales bacterium]